MKGNFYALRRLFSSVNNFSPNLILITVLFFAFTQVDAKTVVIGNGSGNVSQTSMSGLNPGDILAIAPGTYNGGNFSNLSGISIISQSSRVTFTGGISVGADVNVIFSGFNFTGRGFTIASPCNGLRIYNSIATGVATMIDLSAASLAFTGSNYLLRNFTLDDLTMDGGIWFQGNYGGPYTPVSWADSITISHVKFNSNTYGPVMAGAGFFHINIHDNRVVFNGSPADGGDYSIFAISGGSGRIYNNYRSGGWGWFTRFYAANVKGAVPDDVYIYNNINVNTTCYGMIDFHVEPNAVGPYTVGTNLHAMNNTAGNMKDIKFKGIYTNAIVLVASLLAPYTVEIVNNASFNVQTKGYNGQDLGTGVGGNVATWSYIKVNKLSNNNYYATYQEAGFADDVNCQLLAASPLIDAGVTTNFFTDIDGITRPQGTAFDIGAREFVKGTPPPNQPPVARAGADQTITLPTSTVALNGTASSDPDGTIASYSWAQIAGPSTSTITNGNTATPTVSGLIAGQYTYELTVTDNKGATAKAQVKINVNTVTNLPPVANAGADKVITLPTNSVTLDGTASSDPDGTIVSYTWSQVSGPASTITNSTAASTLVTGLTAGTYVFQLVVKDNGGATASNNVTVLVNPSLNQPPSANAGADQTITLPTSSVSVDASGSIDADGTIVSYKWTQSSGPSAATIASPGNVITSITGLIQGTYIFKLLVTDNNGATGTDSIIIKVNAAANKPPVANAGASKSITLPVNSVNLDGTASSDPDGTIASYSWAQISGPSTSTITNGNTSTPTASGLIAGQYTFELTVADNQGATAKAQVKINVIAAGSLPPVANAGADQNITLPTNQVILNGTASQAPAGNIVTNSWTQNSGPSAATIVSAGSATTFVNNLIQGTYVFKLTITDNTNATASDIVTITVNAAANQPPIANAGLSKTITLPANSLNLNGTGSSDPDGTIAAYSWAQVAGPSTATITNGNTSTPTVGALIAGQYTFELTVTDNQGATAKAQVKINVLAAPNQPPVANAGIDKTITLPTSSITLDGSLSSDPDGTIASYSWNKITGPGAITITNSNTATATATGLQAGQYVFELTVTDNQGAVGRAQVKITVNAATPPPATNQPPIANAGSDQTITLPATSVTLNGTNSYDPDGTIVTYAWSQVSGPSTAVMSGAGSGTPAVSSLKIGQYIFELAVTDNKGAVSKDRVTITVADQTNKPNQPPVANAGADTTISLPANSVVLNGSASIAPSGTITTYQWQEMSGPNTAAVSSFSNAVSTISGLVIGNYTFQLTVTDNNGATATASVKVKVVDNLRSQEQILLYPNPAHDIVNVRLISDSLGTVKVNIYDMNGKLVNASQMEKQQSFIDKSINITRLADGMYTLQAVIGTNKIMLSKFIKQ